MREELTPNLEELLRLVRADDWRAALRADSEATNLVLRRCAAVRTFDRALFATALCVGPERDMPELDELVELGYVEPLPNRLDEYRVPGASRDRFLRLWWP